MALANMVKGQPVRVFSRQALAALSDEPVDCTEANAVHIEVFALGGSPSADISVLGATERGGNYLALPDLNATQTGVNTSRAFDVIVGQRWVKLQLANVTGSFTIYATPYVSGGMSRVAASISVDTLAAIQANIGAATISDKLSMPGVSGAIAIGATPPTSATVGTGIWIDRTGMYGLAADVQQAIFSAVTGAITAGAGNALMDVNGFSVLTSTAFADTRAYRMLNSDGTVVLGGLHARQTATPARHYLELQTASITGDDSQIHVRSYAPVNQVAYAALVAVYNSTQSAYVDVQSDSVSTYIGLNAITTNITGGLNLGSATGAATGELKASAGIYGLTFQSAQYNKGSALASGATWDNIVTLVQGAVYLGVVTTGGTYHNRATYVIHFFDSADVGVAELLDTGYSMSTTLAVSSGGVVSVTNNGANSVDSAALTLLRII